MSTRFSLSAENGQDDAGKPVSQDQILRRERGQGNSNFPCSADHEQDRQPYRVDPYSALRDVYIYINTTWYIPI